MNSRYGVSASRYMKSRSSTRRIVHTTQRFNMTTTTTTTTKKPITTTWTAASKAASALLSRLRSFSEGSELITKDRHHFGHALSLGHRQIQPDNFLVPQKDTTTTTSNNNNDDDTVDVNDGTLSTIAYRYPVRPHVASTRLTTGTVLAIFDEFTTGHVASALPTDIRPGVSVHLEATMVDSSTTRNAAAVGQDVVLTSQVVKIGRTMAFMNGHVTAPTDSNDGTTTTTTSSTPMWVVSHVKYQALPNWLIEFIMTGWRAGLSHKLVSMLYEKNPPKYDKDGQDLDGLIQSSLQHTAIGRGTFTIRPEHCNPLKSFHVSRMKAVVAVTTMTTKTHEGMRSMN